MRGSSSSRSLIKCLNHVTLQSLSDMFAAFPDEAHPKMGYFHKSKPSQADVPPQRIAGSSVLALCMVFFSAMIFKCYIFLVVSCSARVCEMSEVFRVPVADTDKHRQTYSVIKREVRDSTCTAETDARFYLIKL